MTLRTHREWAFHRLAVSYRPRLVPTSSRPATKNTYAVLLFPPDWKSQGGQFWFGGENICV